MASAIERTLKILATKRSPDTVKLKSGQNAFKEVSKFGNLHDLIVGKALKWSGRDHLNILRSRETQKFIPRRIIGEIYIF